MEKEIKPHPICTKYFITASPATIEDVIPDFDRIAAVLKDTHSVEAESIDFNLLSSLPHILRESNWEVTVTVRAKEIINVEGGDMTGSNYGVAIDLGNHQGCCPSGGSGQRKDCRQQGYYESPDILWGGCNVQA
ncbi:MAG: hypothetical protein U5N58_06765 [Actinomycetota bacterium]|nr:hypothetical protein [Actinomycetota bacterium]